jgi:phosphate transport system permease protein
MLVGFLLGPPTEWLLFYNDDLERGDVRGWLDSRIGNDVGGWGALGATPGWLFLLWPIVGIALTLLYNLSIRPRLQFLRTLDRTATGVVELVRFVVVVLVSVLLAWALGALLSMAGFDLREPIPPDSFFQGGLIGQYIQRNTLIIGIIMGFAIIPIIYTVSEDALSSVPNTLRSAALGAGATPWQTAIRIVLPVAVSGIFSACMIGFGRAAGETMIVLMAGGNTATLDPSIFTGIRPLSANIATELPEAPVGSTHYRVLFLSAMLLFVLTFILNTLAEIIRQRFRKRAYQL